MAKNKWMGPVIAAILWSAFLFGAGWLSHMWVAAATRPSLALSAGNVPMLDEVWGYVRQAFVGEVPSDTVRNYGAVRGALATLNDHYTILLEPQTQAMERDYLSGQFGGIGVDIRQDAQGRIILSPRPDSPAQAAGLQDGDILLGIDGVVLPASPNFEEVAARVRGDNGTAVRLSVMREGQRLEFTVTRTLIQVPSVEWRAITITTRITPAKITSATVGYISIHLFTERTSSEVQAALKELRAKGSQAYLMDLRDNGGGLVDAAVQVASQFIPDGVVAIERRRGQPDVSLMVTGVATGTTTGDAAVYAYREPLVVLINGKTASAAEIVAGAIQDRQRGKLLGEKSFGKGSVQSIYDLSDGSSMHITSAKWLTPQQRAIDGEGLRPDIEVAQDAQGSENTSDTPLERAVQALRDQLAHATR
jgi:carboxyl-terminal processing protease